MKCTLDAQVCGTCGHLFSTKFVPNAAQPMAGQPQMGQTQMNQPYQAPMQPGPAYGYGREAWHQRPSTRSLITWLVVILALSGLGYLGYKLVAVNNGLVMTWSGSADKGDSTVGWLENNSSHPFAVSLSSEIDVPPEKRSPLVPGPTMGAYIYVRFHGDDQDPGLGGWANVKLQPGEAAHVKISAGGRLIIKAIDDFGQKSQIDFKQRWEKGYAPADDGGGGGGQSDRNGW